jgi:hypothetical protein
VKSSQSTTVSNTAEEETPALASNTSISASWKSQPEFAACFEVIAKMVAAYNKPPGPRPADAGSLITARSDRSGKIQSNPLILIADQLFPSALGLSPYFGYFPPNSSAPELVLIDHSLEFIKAAARNEAFKAYTLHLPDEEREPCFAIVPVEGKGLGMVATRDINRGELIYRER